MSTYSKDFFTLKMKNLQDILSESINYELDTYNMYILFAQNLQNDAEFWETLAEEELNHTSVLRKIQQFYQGDSTVIDIISVKDVKAIQESRRHMEKLMVKFVENPNLKMACNIGMEIEKSVVEKSYQKFMSIKTDDSIIQLFQALNGEEKDHFKRIQKHSQEKN